MRTTCRVSIPGVSLGNESKAPPRFLRDKKIVPDADPPHREDIHKLYQLFEQRFIIIPTPILVIYIYIYIYDPVKLMAFFSFFSLIVLDSPS